MPSMNELPGLADHLNIQAQQEAEVAAHNEQSSRQRRAALQPEG